ncbi:RIO1 family regulatory kinase/ATPase domain-containing protein [Deinococcus cellulosilyticus]|uniref:non-specific serine/threonine protein kinase n=1 Tax=Deinococcus cellulosilyticus (strain DSM 18568 / NBRC 106333 / KACC 11606 / 5516J-15) TaxID=1223518 RepID=A0A511MZX9_DEIC1|nr:RIO1 family regulatory kinase/ATPase [Deinococcus cellulosilyticus]GEM46180.1 serine/threonine protein kinase [Deinococcus cellulosilyticus NBRC 106333 = KACC 11606]
MPKKSFDANHEKYRSKQRKPQTNRKATEQTDAGFSDPALAYLHKKRLFSELLYEHFSGKEATIYVLQGQERLLAAKLYTDARIRSFQRDELYQEGRFITNNKAKKAMATARRFGITPEQALWVSSEFQFLSDLFEAGLPVPEPVEVAGKVLLMEFIGDEDAPAPRLSDERLDWKVGEGYFEQSLDMYARLLKLGYIHGDYSAYNMLLHNDRLVLIDFPQTIKWREHPEPIKVLEQDMRGLTMSFSKYTKCTPEEAAQEVIRRSGITEGELRA